MVKQHAKVETDSDDNLIEQVYMPAAKKHICDYAGLSGEQAEELEDLSIPYLAVCAHLIDHRGMIAESDTVNQVIDAFLQKHSRNLL